MALMTQVGLEFIARNRAAGTMNQFERSLRSVGGTMLRMAGLGGGLYALQRGFASMIRLASDAQETLNKFNVVFRDQAGIAAQWAKEFGDKVGRATQDVQKWMASLQDLFVPLGFARDKAFELSKTLTELAVDVASFNNQADAETIRDFTSALVGNHEAVRKYGIIITEASLKQEALNKGITQNYADLTNLEKVSLRYGIIQRASTDAQGDAVRTADSYANQIKRLNANWTEFQTNLGTLIIPSLSKLVSVLNQAVEQPDKLSKGWTNLSFAMSETLIKTGQMNYLLETQWKIAKRWYDLEGGTWQKVGPGGRFTVPEDMKHFKELLEHFQSGAPGVPLNIPADRLKVLEEMRRKAAELQRQMGQIPVVNENAAALTTEQMRQIIERTREAMESVRHQDYLTRMERIESLRIYQAENAATLSQVAEANRILDEEIRSIERSRLDAMKIYQAELREDMQNFNLYLSEQFANASRSMESAFSSSFQTTIREGGTWRDFLIRYIDEVRNAWIKMLADMTARQFASSIIQPVMGGLFKFITGGLNPISAVTGAASGAASGGSTGVYMGPLSAVVGHQGGRLGIDAMPTRYVSPRLFENAPKYHDLGADEVAVIGKRGEEISRAGRSRSAPPSVVINNYTGQNFAVENPPSFDGERWVVGIVAKNIKEGGPLKKMMR